MANVLVNDLYLSDIADAIREKLDTEDTYKPSEMANAIESIPSGGSTINNQNKTVHPSSSDQSVTADTGYTGLGTVSVKAVTMSNLSASNIVEGVTVKIGDADDDDRIASVTGTASGGITPTGTKQISITQNGTTTEDVTNYASAEITVNVQSGGTDYLAQKVQGTLVSYTSDDVTAVVTHGFANCLNLQTLKIHNATSIDNYAFLNCASLLGIALPSLLSSGHSLFSGCSAMKYADFGSSFSSIPSACFNNCTSFDTLILRNSSVVTLANVSAFNGTKFKSGGAGGTIYVPQALLNTYPTSGNWATVNGYGTITWAKIEGSIYENAYADGTPIS